MITQSLSREIYDVNNSLYGYQYHRYTDMYVYAST